jgi:soluble lytic murein transglycosylase
MAALLAAGCAERVSGVPPAQSTAPGAVGQGAGSTVVLAATAPGGAAGAPLLTEAPWADAVRMERWVEAATKLDALPEADRARAEIRYVRARVALAQKDSARAVALLAGLEPLLPALAGDVARWRAEAAADAGPYPEAAAYFARAGRARDFLRAAQALEKGGDQEGARKMADKAVGAADKGKSVREQAAARALRARLNEAAGKPAFAVGDYRWLAMKAAATPEAASAPEALVRLQAPLSAKERMQAVGEMIDRGAAAEALAEIARIDGKPGFARLEVMHARAMALYKSRNWSEAAKSFQEVAAAKSGREAEQLFYAARCLSRCDKDNDAIKIFQDISSRYKKTMWSERATYLSARLLLQNGRFKEAAEGFKRYLANFPKGEERADAEFERALALVSAESPKTARAAFGLLAKNAKPDIAARLRQLEGLAALRAGDKDEAVRVWTEVARSQPLTWAAQVSRARLAAAGAPLPPLIDPPAVRPAQALVIDPPRPFALLASLGLDGDAEAWLAGNEQDAASRYVGRESEALCAMYGSLSRAKRRYRVGNAAVGWATLMKAPSAADRWTWECVYPRPYAAVVKALEEQYALPKGLIHSLMRQESAFDPVVLSPVSAVGLMQLMPSTARAIAGELGETYDPSLLTSPEVNVRYGAFYIAKLLKTFKGSIPLAAAAYNAGPQAVSHWLETGKDMDADLWVARIPFDETRNYVARVMGNLARYQWLDGSDAAVLPVALELPVDARAEADAY